MPWCTCRPETILGGVGSALVQVLSDAVYKSTQRRRRNKVLPSIEEGKRREFDIFSAHEVEVSLEGVAQASSAATK
jgi:hypothetical protein